MKLIRKSFAPIKNEKNTGSCTLEALIALTVFLVSVVTVIMFSNAVRAEKSVQLALDRTAEEISADCYTASLICDRIHEGIAKKAKDSDSETGLLLGAADGLLSMTRGSYESSDIGSVAGSLLSGTLESLASGDGSVDEAFFTSLEQFGDSPAGACAGIAGMLLCDKISEESSHLLAVTLCNWIMPKYLCSAFGSTGLEKLGIEGGFNGIDFSDSEVLPDGNGIKLIAVYTVSLFPGNTDILSVKLTSVSYTLSWCRQGEYELESKSFWSYDNFRRGKLIKASVKKQYPTLSVKSGYGFDLYNASSGEFTLVVSMNLFSSDYSDCSATDRKNADVGDFSLKKSGIIKELKSDSNDLKKSVESANGKTVLMENGGNFVCGTAASYRLYVVIPEECSAFDSVLSEVSESIETSTGVKVVFKGKGKALGNDD